MSAARALDSALLTMAHRQQCTPCQGRDAWLWLSEYYSWRAVAIPLCSGCQLHELCGQYATEIKASFGVYGGIDRTPTNRRAIAS